MAGARSWRAALVALDTIHSIADLLHTYSRPSGSEASTQLYPHTARHTLPRLWEPPSTLGAHPPRKIKPGVDQLDEPGPLGPLERSAPPPQAHTGAGHHGIPAAHGIESPRPLPRRAQADSIIMI